MDKKLTLRFVFVFAVCLTGIGASEADDSTSLHANKTVSRSTPTNTVLRKEYVELGTTVTLNCTNTNIVWHDIFYVIWKIHLRHKECKIGIAINESIHDTCHDGKMLNRTTDGAYHLIIPNFSIQDEGNYTCDNSYPAGGWLEIINVSAFAHLHISGWLEHNDTHTVAVCEATGKPPVSMHWETPWNLSSPITQVYETTGQLPTVISRLHLPSHSAYRNIICVATSNDLSHTETQFSDFTFRDTHGHFTLSFLLVGITCSIMALLTGLYVMRKKLTELRNLCCKQSNDPEELCHYATLSRSEVEAYSTLSTPPTYENIYEQINIYTNA